MANNFSEGIVFGQHFLDKKEFLEVIDKWYDQKFEGFRLDVIQRILIPLEKIKNKYGSNTRLSQKYGVDIDMELLKEITDISKIYSQWDEIQKKWFGNEPVELGGYVTTDSENPERIWFSFMEEAPFVTDKGKIEVSIDKLKEVAKSYSIEQSFLSVLNLHYEDFLRQLKNYKLNSREARQLHIYLGLKKSSLRKYVEAKLVEEINEEHLTSTTYNYVFYERMKNEGKQADAYFTHLGRYHKPILSYMRTNYIFTGNEKSEINQLKNNHFPEIFKRSYYMREWLTESMNNTPWYAGGDLVVTDGSGKVVFNVQIKSTKHTEAEWKLGVDKLKFVLTQLISSNKEEFGNKMFDNFKNSLANSDLGTKVESKILDKVYERLGLNKDIKIS